MSLDVAAMYDDVRRLVCAHPAYKSAVADGLDGDDLLQDVLLRMVSRQRGRSAYDPTRASLGRYVWLVTSSAVANYRRDHREREVLGQDDVDGATVEAADTLPLTTALMRLADEAGLDEAERRDLVLLVAGELRRTSRRGRRVVRRLRGARVGSM